MVFERFFASCANYNILDPKRQHLCSWNVLKKGLICLFVAGLIFCSYSYSTEVTKPSHVHKHQTLKEIVKPKMNVIHQLLPSTKPVKHFFVEDLEKASNPPKRDAEQIFFIESLKNSYESVNITAKQACAIESAANTNPDLDVFVLFSHPVKTVNITSAAIVEAVRTYKNVHFYQFDELKYTKDTPLEKFMSSGLIKNSSHIVEHTSDVFRILTLWKYSGTYFDLDVMVQKPVKERGINFACIQTDLLINSAILNLHGDLGRSISGKMLDEVANHFNGSSWCGNGPEILSNLVKKMCKTEDIKLMDRKHCSGFQVYPTEDCYAIAFPEWRYFFEEQFLNEALKATNKSFAIHFWNSLSRDKKISTKSKAFYIHVAQKLCPRVLSACGNEF